MIYIEAYHASIGRYRLIFYCCICQYYYMSFLRYLFGSNWCCLCKLSEIPAYWLFMLFSWVKLLRCNLNFLKLKQLLIVGDIESNPGPTQNYCKSPLGAQRKLKRLKKSTLMLLVIQSYRIVFSIKFNQSA